MYVICLKILGGGYEGKPSIFDNISQDDLIMAFFPCTRFEAKVPLWFRGECYQQKNWSLLKKLECSMQYQKELTELYLLLCQLVIVCIKNGLKLIIENPYTAPHYLTTCWCVKPTIIDKDRTQRGDYYKKPTQYWFINCEPKSNLVFEPLDYVEKRTIAHEHKRGNIDRKTNRSMIHPQYANRFIREFILD